MQYLRSPYKLAQYSVLVLDLLASFGLIAFVLQFELLRISVVFYAVWPAAIMVLTYVFGGYDLLAQPVRSVVNRRVILAIALASIAASPFVVGLVAERVLGVAAMGGVALVAMVLSRGLSRVWLARQRKPRAVIYTYSENASARLGEVRSAVGNCYKVIEINMQRTPDRVAPEAVESELVQQPALVVYEPTPQLLDLISSTLVKAQVHGTRVVDFPTFYGSFTGRLPLELIDENWLLHHYRATQYRVMYNRLRRTLDIFVATFALPIAVLPTALLAALVWATSPGPALFTQERIGRFRRTFVLYKLRSMTVESEHSGAPWVQPNDPRVTPVGRILRKSHLDELPQLINLLRGEVSLIGPRPIRASLADQLAARLPHYELRFLNKPGLTGWPQVMGIYGANQDEQTVKLEMELYYIQNASLFLDLYILLKTVQVMIRQEPYIGPAVSIPPTQ